MTRSLFAVALLLQLAASSIFWPSVSRAGWGSGGCGPVGPVVRPVQADRWTFHNGCWYLYRGNVQVAGYDPEAQIYRTYDAQTGAWGAPQTAPWAPALPAKARPGCICPDCRETGQCADGCACSMKAKSEALIEQNFGVDRDKITGHNKYTINGREVAQELALEAVTGKQDALTDDSTKLRLTVIGSDVERKQVLNDVQTNPVLSPLKDTLLVQDYAPTEWETRPGFANGGHPTIYLQAPDGKVLYHRDDYQQGPEGIAGAVRKADPKYDPAKDPNGSPSLPNIDWSDLQPYAPLAVLGVLGIVALGANMRKRK